MREPQQRGSTHIAGPLVRATRGPACIGRRPLRTMAGICHGVSLGECVKRYPDRAGFGRVYVPQPGLPIPPWPCQGMARFLRFFGVADVVPETSYPVDQPFAFQDTHGLADCLPGVPGLAAKNFYRQTVSWGKLAAGNLVPDECGQLYVSAGVRL